MDNSKVNLYRYSGDPVNLADREAYQTDWTAFYDKAAARAQLDMLKLQRFLRFGERALVKKHNKEVTINLPVTEQDWQALMAAYEQCPIMVAQNKVTGSLVAIIMDKLE